MSPPDLPLLLTIEKMIYGGDGLARLPADEKGRGKAVFVPFVIDGEKIEASLTEQTAGFARARADTINEPSPHRVKPGCPYFAKCGGCHYQHASYEHQLEIKKEILRESLKRTAKIELSSDIQVHPSPPWNYRNRSRLQVQTVPEFRTGYFRFASHELMPIEECPISSPLINRGITALWQNGRAGHVPRGVREVEFFANADDTQLLIGVSAASDGRRAELRGWAEAFHESMAEIAGITVFREKAAAPRESEKLLTVAADHLIYQTKRSTYRVSAGSFFQTNRHLTDELVKIVTENQNGKLALDLYAGVGLFSTALSGDFHHIVSVESSQTSTADLAYNLHSKEEAIQATTEQYLSGMEKGRSRKGSVLPPRTQQPDLAVVDPPRGGLGERVARMLTTLGAPRVVYVSCDPVTLSRDLVTLLAGGYRIEQVHLVDVFPQTYHLESVVHLAR